MAMSELKNKSVKDLNEEVHNLKQEQMNLRFQKAYGQLESPKRVRIVRKEIARINTCLTMKKREDIKNATT